MRFPGWLPDRSKALDEAVAQFVVCPTCGDELGEDRVGHWDQRLVRVLVCPKHGYFFVKYSVTKKKIRVDWIFERYLEDVKGR